MRWLLAALGLLIVVLGLGAAWLLGTQPGLHWSARLAQGAIQELSLEGLRGALAGEVAFEEIRFQTDGTDVRLRNGEVQLELLAVLGGRAGVRSLRAEELFIALRPGEGKPSRPPALPIGVRIHSVDIARIRYGGLLLEDFQLKDAALREQGQISGNAAFAVNEAAYPARVQVQLAGALERIEATASGSVAEVPFSAKAVLTPFAEHALRALDAHAGPANLSQLRPEWPHTELTARVSGEASAANAFSGTVRVHNAQPGPLDRQRVPADEVTARFATDFSVWTLQDLRVALSPGGTLVGKGRITAQQARLELRADDVDLRAFRSTLHETRLRGPLTIHASRERQSVRGTLSQDGMSLSVDAVRTGDAIDVRSLRAAAGGGEATGTAELNLSQPMRFSTKLRLARFDPAQFGDYPQGSINGSLEAKGQLGGQVHADARWVIERSTLLGRALASRGAARMSRGRISQTSAEATLGSARLAARGDFGRAGDQLAVRFHAPDVANFLDGISGRLTGDFLLAGSWATPQGRVEVQGSDVTLPNRITLESLTLKAAGALAQHDAEVVVRAEGLDVTARLRGGWSPKAGWIGELYALRNAGRYPLQLSHPAPLAVAPERIELGRLQAKLGEGRLLVKQIAWSPGRLSSSGEFSGLPAQWLILAGGFADRVRASALLDGHWNLEAEPRLQGSLALQRSSGDVALIENGDIALALEAATLEARFNQGAMKATVRLASRYGTADVQASVEGFSRDAPIALTARLRFAELRTLLQPYLDGARVDGRLAAELKGSGTLGHLSLTGSVQGDALALQIPPYGVYLKDGELRAVLEGDRLRVTRFIVRGGEGELTASGALPLRISEGEANLQWAAKGFQLLERPDLRLTVSGAGAAALAQGKVSLTGALRADRGYVELEQQRLPQLGDDVVIEGRTPKAARERARLPVALDVQLDLGEQLQVRGYGLEGKLAGRLQVETTKNGELRAYGRIHAVNATFLAYGQRLEVDPGVAIFDGPLDNPSLQLTAWRRNQQVEAGVQVSGTARAPRVQLVSQPPVPEGERLAWLVLGRAPGEATKADLGLLQAAAGALLARGDQMPFDRRIAQAFGLDEISLRGSGEVGDRVVAVGKRLSDRLYVSYEQGLGVVASALVKLDLALTQRLSVRAETGTSSGVGLFYRFSWD